MASLRRYDVQAKYSVILSVLAILPLLAAVAACFRNYVSEIGAIQYGKGSPFMLIVLACIGLAGLLSGLGLLLGFNSAEQRRNDANAKSWLGFFIGTLGVCLTIIVFAGFYFLRLQINTG